MRVKGNSIIINYNNDNIDNGRFKDSRFALNHEVQHHIQLIEGFAVGTSPGYIRGLVETYIRTTNPRDALIGDGTFLERRVYRAIQESIQTAKSRGVDIINIDEISNSIYLRFYGEIEARNVQKRAGETKERLSITPLNETEETFHIDDILILPSEQQNTQYNAN